MTVLAHDFLLSLAAIEGVDLLRPDDPGFFDAAAITNTDVQKQAAAVAQCSSAAAVAAVVTRHAAFGEPITVRGGGYSVAGFGTAEDAVVLSLRALDTIEIDDATGIVRVGAGVTAGELDRALGRHGLVLNLPVPSEPSVIGAALSGGIGFTLREAGFLCDAMVSATVVTAAGALIEVDDEAEPELMWALRGGGGNFGVVIEARFQAARIDSVSVIQQIFPLSAMGDLMRLLREWSPDVPPQVTVVAMVRSLPPIPRIPAHRHGKAALFVSAVHCGSEDDVERDIRPLLRRTDAIFTNFVRTPLAAFRDVTDAAFPHARFGIRVRSAWIDDELTDAAIEQLCTAARTMPDGHCLLELAPLGGRLVERRATSAAPGRDAAYLFNLMAIWLDEPQRTAALIWLDSMGAAVNVLSGRGGLVPGFASADEPQRSRETYGQDFDRLRAIKRRYDPTNLLRRNLNVDPK